MKEKIDSILNSKNREKIGQKAQKTIPVSWEKVVEKAMEEYRKV